MKMLDDEMRSTIVRMQLDNLCAILGAKVTRSSTLDHTGKEEKKLTLTYPPENDY